MKSLDVDCKVSAYCTINASEDINKVRVSLSNVLTDTVEKLTGDSLVANSNNHESLAKIYETMRSRKTKSAYRRHLMRNMVQKILPGFILTNKLPLRTLLRSL